MADDLPETTEASPNPAPAPGAAFAVVGIGASAGGLEALQQLLKALPAETGMAFVVVQHLAPDQASSLAEILARATAMPVAALGEETAVERNHVYVLPPGHDLVVGGGRLKLVEQQQAGLHGIDRFFRSLADDSAHLAVGVVLSGGLNDGTVGLVEIKAAGGVTFAQDESAQHKSMPKSAVAAGCVDFVLPPEGIARELARIAGHPYVAEESASADGLASHARVTEIVRRATGVDFTNYKASTLHRRIMRRMMLQRLATSGEYEEHLRRTPAEVEELYQDILIGVTSFFRDPDAFEALARDVFPKLIAACAPGAPVRFWVVGCSSGEEAYSLAMGFTECAEAMGSAAQLQLFATDVNQRCVEKARAGLYPRSIAQDVSPERLRQFFTEEGGGYRIRKAIRERCVFSRHNALVDPPFLRMDFLSCRNLLIYLEPVLQQHIVPLFHYALKPGGWLWLGSSESVGTVRDLFEATDARHKIHSRRPGGRTPATRVQPSFSTLLTHEPAHLRFSSHGGLPRDAERLLLAKYAPPGVVVSAGLEIVQFQGDTGPYLAPAAGAASLHLLKMLREGLPTVVRDALQRAEQTGAAVRVEALRVRSNGGFRTLAVEVIPVKAGAGKGGGFVVLFDDAARPAAQSAPRTSLGKWWQKLRGAAEARAPGLPAEEILHLTQELASTRETLQAAVEQHEAASEELQSANEEAQSANEEMQSIYEELENSKEEIEASNKELTALSEELASRNADLNRLIGELRESETRFRAIADNIPQLAWLADSERRVVWFNQAWLDYTGTTLEDNVGVGWKAVHHPDHVEAVAEKFERHLREGLDWEDTFPLRGADGAYRWFLSRMKVIRDDAGEVVRFFGTNTDITALREAEAALRESEERFRSLFASAPMAVFACDRDAVIQQYNQRAVELWGREPARGVERHCGSVKLWLPDGTHLPHAQSPILEVLRTGLPALNVEVFIERPDGSRLPVLVNFAALKNARGEITGAITSFIDITGRKRLETDLGLLASVSLDLVRLETVDEIMRSVGARIGAHFQLSLCAFAKINEAADEAVVTHDWHREDVPGLAGVYRIADFVTEEFQRASRAGETFVVRDVTADPRTDAEQFAPLKIDSFVCVPLVQDGQWRFLLGIYDAAPRDWRADEIELIREVTTRIWARLERARTVEALRASEQRALGIIQSIDDGFMTMDAQWRITYLSARGGEILAPLQKTTDNVLGKIFWEEFPATVGAVFEENFRRAARERTPVKFEAHYPPLNRWFDLRAYPSPSGLSIYFLDTTERQQAEEALRLSELALAEQAEELRLADRSKDEFLAMLAHELRNPLAPLRNAAELLKAENVSEEERAQAQRIIGRQIENMSRMLDDLLDVSRITEGKIELRKKPVALEAILTAATSLVHSTCAAHHQELAVSLPREPVYLEADATRLEQVFGNLLGNACKYGGDGCHISLSAEVVEAPSRSDRSDQSDRSDEARDVIVTVRDDGIGIDPKVLPRIFDLFVQASRTLDRAHGGLGIGLTLVQRLVKLHGGSIEAHSEGLGQGAEFIVRLPILSAVPPPAPLPPPPAARDTPRRILIVDDNTDSARSLATLQKRRGHETRTAFTGPDAVAAAAEFRPEVVLLDIGLPGMDGFEVARQLRAMPALAGVLLIAMSGYGRDEDRAEAKLAGFDEYMVKPVDLETLRDWLRSGGRE